MIAQGVGHALCVICGGSDWGSEGRSGLRQRHRVAERSVSQRIRRDLPSLATEAARCRHAKPAGPAKPGQSKPKPDRLRPQPQEPTPLLIAVSHSWPHQPSPSIQTIARFRADTGCSESVQYGREDKQRPAIVLGRNPSIALVRETCAIQQDSPEVSRRRDSFRPEVFVVNRLRGSRSQATRLRLGDDPCSRLCRERTQHVG